MDIVRMQFELESKIGKKVDLLTYDSIHPLLKKNNSKRTKDILWKKILKYFLSIFWKAWKQLRNIPKKFPKKNLPKMLKNKMRLLGEWK